VVSKRPVVGVGAVVFNPEGRILLIQRGKSPHYGRWMVPGGTVEWGETLEEATVREVREETGIDIEIETFVELIEAISPEESGYHFVIVDYAAHAIAGSLRAASDAKNAVWASADSLAEYDLTPEMLAVIEKARTASGRTPAKVI